MKRCAKNLADRFVTSKAAFTLVELLVTISILSLLLGIMLPALRRARMSAGRVLCQHNLNQISLAWQMYLDDNNGYFLQDTDAQNMFGGWAGTGSHSPERPLNRYLGLPKAIKDPAAAKIFKCPSDRGGLGYEKAAYEFYGNSYQTNLMLIGNGELPLHSILPDTFRQMHSAINKLLKDINRSMVCSPSRLLLVGDHNWYAQTYPFMPEDKGWHGQPRGYNIAFFDGHVDFVEILPGFYITTRYRVIPFRQMDELAARLGLLER